MTRSSSISVDLCVDFLICIGKTTHIMLKLLKVTLLKQLVESNVFLLVYVQDTYVLLPIILYNFPCLETFVNPGKYLPKP